MISKFKSWNKLSLTAEISILENISAYFKDIMLGLEEDNNKWNLFFNSMDSSKVSNILDNLKSSYEFIYQIEEIEYDDWHLKWKKNFHPIIFDERLIIAPDWDSNKYNQNYIIKIKPGMSFGTGHHETTFLMIQELLKLQDLDKKILDLGSGSGILSIVAKKLGFEIIRAIEFDEICKDDIYYNMKINLIDNEDIDVSFQDARSLDNYDYDIILINIEKIIIMDLIPLIKVKNSKVILSGILIDQEQEVYNKLIKENFRNISINKKGEWVCLVADYI